jgi:hypothetical protein
VFRKNYERLAVEKIEFLFDNVARLLHVAFDPLRRGMVTPQACEPAAAVEIDNGDAAVRSQIFLQTRKITHPVGEMVVRIDG